MDNTYKFNLQLFADGGAGGASGGDGGAAAGADGATGVNVPAAGERKSRRRENPLAGVQYGIQQQNAQQVAPAQEDAANNGTDNGEDDFESLIKGKHKAAFDAKVQDIIRNRFKTNSDNEKRLEEMQPLLEALGKRHNVDPTDIDALMSAVSMDDEALEAEAIERNMSVDTLKTVKQLEMQNERMRKNEERSAAEQRMQEHFNSLAQQAQNLKGMYPDFDLMTELKNPAFARLTAPGVGIDVKTAYETVHLADIKAQGMQYAAQQTAQKMANAVRSNSMRPVENGLTGTQSASTVKTDPRQLTRADREEIRRRVARGEKIVF